MGFRDRLAPAIAGGLGLRIMGTERIIGVKGAIF
jgi:hypothetical protein